MGRLIQKKASILTERLTLKPYSLSDTDRLVDLLTNRRITQTFIIPDFETEAQARAFAEKLIRFSQIDDVRHLEYGIYKQGCLIGFINDCGIEEDSIEIGYVIHPDEQGHGYATEAIRAIFHELREMGFKKVTAGFFPENLASRRVMEKCGMKQSELISEEKYRGVLHQCLYYEICF